MPKQRYQRREPTHDWQQIRPLSPQMPLWEPGEVEWFVIIRKSPPLRRRKRRGRLVLIQPPLWANAASG